MAHWNDGPSYREGWGRFSFRKPAGEPRADLDNYMISNARLTLCALVHWIGDMEQRMPQQRSRFKQTTSLDQRLTNEAERLRKEARGTPPGVERAKLIRRARLAETGSRMSEWLSSPGLKAPT